MYLSGVIGEEALKVQGKKVTENVSLGSSLEEADEGIFLHVNHAINTTGDENILIASSDIDVIICAVYYFHKVFQSNGLKQFWIIFLRLSKAQDMFHFMNYQKLWTNRSLKSCPLYIH